MASSKLELTDKATSLMKELILLYIRQEEKIEVLRQFLVSNEFFDMFSAFNRIDRNQDGFISPLEFLNFFRDNVMMLKALLFKSNSVVLKVSSMVTL